MKKATVKGKLTKKANLHPVPKKSTKTINSKKANTKNLKEEDKKRIEEPEDVEPVPVEDPPIKADSPLRVIRKKNAFNN